MRAARIARRAPRVQVASVAAAGSADHVQAAVASRRGQEVAGLHRGLADLAADQFHGRRGVDQAVVVKTG